MSYGAAERSVIDIDEFERRLRGPAPRPTADPLAELARLVTPATAKPEALDAIFARSRPQEPEPEPVFDDSTAFRMDELRGPVADDAAFVAEPYDHGYDAPAVTDEHPHIEAEAGDDWAYAPGDERPAEMEAPRSRRPLYATAAVIVVGLLGIGSTFAFRGHGASDGALVEVKAPAGPTKVQAQTAANDSASTAANSTVLDRGASPAPVTRVVTRQEQPVDLKEVAKAPRVVSLSPGGNGQLGSAPAEAGTVFAEPRKVKTVSVRPDGTIVGSATDAAAPTAAAAPAATPPAAQTATPPARSATPKAATRVATTPKPPAENTDAAAKTPAPKPVAAKPAQAKVADASASHAATASHGGGFVVQLAAPGNEAEAKSVASKLGQKFSGPLEGARVTVQKASDKDVYRVRTAGMSREDAVATCERIKAAGGACFVAKN